ncbi:LysR family transcriptional regulator [Pseudochelatococcus sp. B33]
MLIRHLKFFVTLAEEQHFGRAAERCNVTQSTLSQAIRKLEDELNVALIARGHRFTSLTPEGAKMLQWGRQILADYNSLQDDLSGNRKGLTGTLRLGVIPAAMPSVSFLSERFEARHPLVSIEVHSMSSRAIQKGLDNFDIDGGLTYLENEPLENVHCVPLYHERYVFACRRDHPLAQDDAVTWADAVTQPLCLLTEDMQNRRILNSIALSAGLELRPRVVSNSFLGVASHLRNGLWCAIVPHTFAFVFGGTPDLVLREMVKPSRRQLVGLVLSDRLPQSPMAAALRDCTGEAEFEQRFALAFRKSL